MESKNKQIDKRVIRNIIILIVIILYIGFKFFMLNVYNPETITNKEDYQNFMEHFAITDTMTINHKNIKNNEEYLTFKNMKIRNDFKDYKVIEELSTEDSIKYGLYDENNELIASFWMGKTKTYANMLQDKIDIFGLYNSLDKNSNVLKSIITKNNITTDVELIKYLQEHKNDTTNVLSLVSKMKENYYRQAIMIVLFPILDHITLINGDYNGYIIHLENNNKEVSIEKGNDKYVFLFLQNDQYTDEYINDLISTLVIK